MEAYFFDTSALIKRYVVEAGSTWVRNAARPTAGNTILISRLTEVELISAVARRQRGGSLTGSQAQLVVTRFKRHLAVRYFRLEVTPDVFVKASDHAERFALRALDALQLAVATEVNAQRSSLGMGPLTLVSADAELNAAALQCGLRVENPN